MKGAAKGASLYFFLYKIELMFYHKNMGDYRNKAIDVICQHTKDGNMIPLKLRIQDEEGEFQSYAVKGYKDCSHKGNYTTPNGIISTSTIFPFECKINVFGTMKVIEIYYNSAENLWRLSRQSV